MRDLVEEALEAASGEKTASSDEFRPPRIGLVECGSVGNEPLSAVVNAIDPTSVVSVGSSSSTASGTDGFSDVPQTDRTAITTLVSNRLSSFDEGDLVVTIVGDDADSSTPVAASTSSDRPAVAALDGVARTGALSICLVRCPSGNSPPGTIIDRADLTIPIATDAVIVDTRSEPRSSPTNLRDPPIVALTTAITTPITEPLSIPLVLLDFREFITSGRVVTPVVAVGSSDEPPEQFTERALDAPLHGSIPDRPIDLFCHLTLGAEATSEDADAVAGALHDGLEYRTGRCKRSLWGASVREDRTDERQLVALVAPAEEEVPER